jgi:Ca-activated chloride channel family protein
MSQVASIGSEQGGRLVTQDGRTLPLKGAALRADARGGTARVILEQRFENVYDEPLHVTYLMPLPADGAVSGYAFQIGARRVVGEVDKRHRARQRFEEALTAGRTAGLVDQERSSLFTQELGNIPPKSTVVAELTIDQRLTWLAENEGGAWEWRFPSVAGPRYQGAPGRVADAGKIDIAVADAPLPITLKLSLEIRDALHGGKPSSPLHAIHAVERGQRWEVGFSDETGVRLDRDVVVRWPVAAPKVGLSLDIGRRRGAAHAHGLVSIVPPTPGAVRARRRDLSLLLDTSGSMSGDPLAQSVRTCLMMIDTLSDDDTLEMIEFSTAARRWQKRAVNATASNKKDAARWLKKLEAGGGTEMVAGVMEALAPLSSEAQRQVVLLTDGYIGFENEVIKTVAEKLPAGSRLHVVGVGSAVNRSLSGPVSRAGRGVEVIVAPGEDAERPAQRLLARTAQPIVTDLELGGSALVDHAPARLPDLFAGSPALAAVALRPEGGELTVRGRSIDGSWTASIQVPATAEGTGSIAAAALFARERVEDLELKHAVGESVNEEIERIGLEFQISTRLTTFIAISEEPTVDPTSPTRREDVPQELPFGVSAEGLGLRPAEVMRGVMPGVMAAPAAPMGASATRAGGYAAHTAGPPKAGGGILGGIGKAVERLKSAFSADQTESAPPAEQDEEGEAGADLDEVADAKKEVDRPMLSQAKQPPAPEKRPEARKDAQEKAKKTRQARRRLHAIVRLHSGKRLVLEIVVAGGELEWAPSQIAASLADGTQLAARLDSRGTTRAGSYADGQVLRLAIELDGDEAPSMILIGDLEVVVGGR